jgi:DNA-binding transcriptional LysR family regulator
MLAVQNSPMTERLREPASQNRTAADWDDLRYVLMLARLGSLSAAARRLGVNHTTVARRVAAAEARLGTRLFDRIDGTFRPTEQGETVLGHAERIERECEAIASAVAVGDAAPSGTVRLTAVPILVNRLLVPALARFQSRYPGIRLDLVAEPRDLNLTRREADIALRLARPQHGTMLARRVGSLDYAVFATRSGSGRSLPWLAYEDSYAHLPQARWLASRIRKEDRPALFFNDAETITQAVLAGLGKSLLPCFLAEAEPRLRRLGGPAPVLSRELWLLVHREIRPLARIAAVIGWLEGVMAGLKRPPQPATD